jgi:hypothetical protein
MFWSLMGLGLFCVGVGFAWGYNWAWSVYDCKRKEEYDAHVNSLSKELEQAKVDTAMAQMSLRVNASIKKRGYPRVKPGTKRGPYRKRKMIEIQPSGKLPEVAWKPRRSSQERKLLPQYLQGKKIRKTKQ